MDDIRIAAWVVAAGLLLAHRWWRGELVAEPLPVRVGCRRPSP